MMCWLSVDKPISIVNAPSTGVNVGAVSEVAVCAGTLVDTGMFVGGVVEGVAEVVHALRMIAVMIRSVGRVFFMLILLKLVSLHSRYCKVLPGKLKGNSISL
jgi:ABC-type sugar transport system ATPase subunit